MENLNCEISKKVLFSQQRNLTKKRSSGLIFFLNGIVFAASNYDFYVSLSWILINFDSPIISLSNTHLLQIYFTFLPFFYFVYGLINLNTIRVSKVWVVLPKVVNLILVLGYFNRVYSIFTLLATEVQINILLYLGTALISLVLSIIFSFQKNKIWYYIWEIAYGFTFIGYFSLLILPSSKRFFSYEFFRVNAFAFIFKWIYYLRQEDKNKFALFSLGATFDLIIFMMSSLNSIYIFCKNKY